MKYLIKIEIKNLGKDENFKHISSQVAVPIYKPYPVPVGVLPHPAPIYPHHHHHWSHKHWH